MRKCAASGTRKNLSLAECFQNQMERSQWPSFSTRVETDGTLCPAPIRITESCGISHDSKGQLND
jgi:hypothetical protein